VGVRHYQIVWTTLVPKLSVFGGIGSVKTWRLKPDSDEPVSPGGSKQRLW